MELTVEQAPVGDLHEYPGNPRRGDIEMIAESLRANGQFRPLVVQAGTNVVLAGNHTLQAAIKLGWPTVAVTRIEVDDDAAKRIVLADNRASDAGDYDVQDLAALLSSLGDLDGSLYTEDYLSKLLGSLDKQAHDDAVAAGDADEEVRSWVAHFQLVFDDDDQRDTWNSYLRWLRTEYPDTETNTERICAHLVDTVPALTDET